MNRRPLRVLVVDDHSDTLTALGMLLRRQGHDVQTAPDGARALEAAKELRPQAVLLDLVLPDMEGYEVARRLSEQERGAAIIALSGYSEEEDPVRARAAGIRRHLTKPVDFETLIRVLDEVGAPQS